MLSRHLRLDQDICGLLSCLLQNKTYLCHRGQPQMYYFKHKIKTSWIANY